MKTLSNIVSPFLLALCFFGMLQIHAQEASEDPEVSFKDPVSRLWINTYGNIQLTDRLFWVAQTHFRFQQTEEVPMFGQVAQVYNRHAISYLYSKKLSFSLGGVLRLNRNTNKTIGQKSWNTEWRIWNEFQFAMPFPRLMIYHRVRIEQRWSKGFNPESNYFFRNRWRYMLNAKIPLNNQKLVANTLYLSPEAELIMQNGNRVVNSPMEDLRLHTSLGYIVNSRLIVASGFMYSVGQDLSDGSVYNQRLTLRLHVYFMPDLRKAKTPLPPFLTGSQH